MISRASHSHSHARVRGQCRTALFAAAAQGSDKTVAVLLAAKANPNLCSPTVRMPILIAWGEAGELAC